MSFVVMTTEHAEQDIDDICDHIDRQDGPERARRVAAHIVEAIERLKENPSRGAYPPELLEMGVREFREIHFKPYRILYSIAGHTVTVLLVADGRRDMQALLARRLLQA